MNDNPAGPDRVHRALLTGLLSNVGMKTDTAEYAGTRGAKFFIFPGSVLFKGKPQWVMAGELVETTRLYARTVAKVTPEWIERAAAHLLKRTYTDPQWNAQRADVTAGERVSLRGLILVPHRTVPYGPIDPRTSREVFIHHALVEGDFRTGAPFLKHNMDLLRQVQSLEAKARRRDLLADVVQRYRFYDRLVPAGIYNGPLFERWRKEAERGRRPAAVHVAGRRDAGRRRAGRPGRLPGRGQGRDAVDPADVRERRGPAGRRRDGHDPAGAAEPGAGRAVRVARAGVAAREGGGADPHVAQGRADAAGAGPGRGRQGAGRDGRARGGRRRSWRRSRSSWARSPAR